MASASLNALCIKQQQQKQLWTTKKHISDQQKKIQDKIQSAWVIFQIRTQENFNNT